MDPQPRTTLDIAQQDVDVLVSALVVGQHREAAELVERWIESGLTYDAICSDGIEPAMIFIGELWEQGRISVAQEHLATAIAQRILVLALDAATFAEPRGQKAVFACVQGNHHALGLRMVSDAFSIAGWDVAYLGADVPSSDLVDHVNAWRPHLLGLSASFADHLSTATDVARSVRARLGADAPRIVVGGRAVRPGTHLPHALDVDIWPGGGAAAAAAV